jgi:hypothetical protein
MLLPLAVYTFGDVYGMLAGPGGSIPFGMGYGSAEEGITFEQLEDKDKMTVGAGGDVLHSLVLNDSAKCGIHFLKTSPLNAAFNAMFELQKSSSLFWGKNLISVANPITGDQNTGYQTAFVRRPGNTYAKDPNQILWEFNIGSLFVVLGTGAAAI